MNIYEHSVHRLKSYVPKFMRIMKLTLVLLITAFMQLTFAASAQKVNLQEKDATLEQIFKKIRLQTGYNVIWNQALLKKGRLVSVSMKDAELTQAMNEVLEGLELSFVIKNKTIIIRKKNELTSMIPAAEQIEIKGKVTDENGVAIPGVTVKVKTSGKVAITDPNGNYRIEADAKSVLVFSYIGFKSIEEPVDGRKSINISMQEDSGRLNEVVVTALGIKRQVKALNYEVQTLKRDDLTTVQSANFTNSLNGKIAGVNINASASGVGGSTRVVMRGVKSISQYASNNVLYVVDGVPLFNKSAGGASVGAFGDISGTESIADFNPDDFESISVLTGPAGAALYGNAAANGAILITTRKGSKDGFKLNYSNSTTALSPFVLPEFQNTYGNRVGEYESWGNKLVEPSTYDAKDFFNTGVQQINSLNTSIGSEKQQSFISFSSTNGKGIIPNNKYNRYNFTFRNSATFLDDKITTDFSASYVKQTDQNMASQGQYFNPLVPLYLFPRNDGFDVIKYYERYNVSNNYFTQYWPYGDQGLQMQNPSWITNRMLFQNARNRYMISGNTTYNIDQGISVTARGRIDNTDGDVTRKYYASTAANFSKPNGYYSWASQKVLQSYVDVIGTFNRTFNDFSVNLNLGSSYVRDKTTTDGLSGHLETVPNLFSIRNINTFSTLVTPFDNKATLGAFASAELGYKGYLYLSATGRKDWSSRQVNSTEESFFYPSLGLSAVISEMFSIPKTIVSYLKVRANYSSVGLPLDALGITPGTVTYPTNNGAVTPISIYPFPDFKAQRTKTFELGANVKFLDNKVALDVTLYKSNTYDQLFLGTLPGGTGYSGFYAQAGNIGNKGIEASLSFNTKYREIGYNTGLVFTLNRNKVVEMVRNYPNPVDGSMFNLTELLVDGTLIREGGQVGDIYTRSFLKTDQNGKIFIDPDGNFSQVNGDYVKLGSVNPDYTLGWRHGFSHKNFNLGFMFFARVGGIVLSQTQGLLDQYGVSQRSAVDRDRGGIPINGGLYPDIENYYRTVAKLEAYNTYSATNVRLQEVSLSYSFPRKIFRDKMGLSLSLTGNNLWMIYNKAPFDPQLTGSTGTFGQGVDYFMMPSLRSLGFGVKVQL
ncbi:SusC/RagA family TonB-linked outer membrane protein [Pedobacter gandavensis]|uniref:SusC/RagA family TonB-linked outer membrane protein n=1 Tax=Pedobacter gandavensis TaxID=2679963 RepID=UPI00292DDC64|nr:SusC/RagA family TonB-linked outer membrane protein [Pedobacter gandavensis]